MIGPIPAAGIQHRYLLTPVIAGEALWGYFVMMEFGGRFGPLDAAAARRSAVIIALEFAAQRRSEDAEAHAREVLLRDLIRGVDDERHTARRASFAGLALDRPHLVALLQRRTGGSLDEDEVESAFAQLDIPHTPGAITIENGSIVFLLEVDPGASRVAAVATRQAAGRRAARPHRARRRHAGRPLDDLRRTVRLPAGLRGGAPGHALPDQSRRDDRRRNARR